MGITIPRPPPMRGEVTKAQHNADRSTSGTQAKNRCSSGTQAKNNRCSSGTQAKNNRCSSGRHAKNNRYSCSLSSQYDYIHTLIDPHPAHKPRTTGAHAACHLSTTISTRWSIHIRHTSQEQQVLMQLVISVRLYTHADRSTSGTQAKNNRCSCSLSSQYDYIHIIVSTTWPQEPCNNWYMLKRFRGWRILLQYICQD